MTGWRLPAGGRIDRGRRLGFTFDGAPLTGHPGDTLASALLAAGRTLVGRSFKYHRPRGIVTAGSAEPNALVTVGTGGRRTPNARATMVELHDGLVAESQNRWPSLGLDVGAAAGLLAPFLSAGFYYKTFMWPRAFWEKVYEPAIRRAAGLGRAGTEADPDPYEKRWAHCDLLVVGAGPAGLAAALAGGRAGARVILADEGSEPGGTLLHERARIGGAAADAFLAASLAELASLPNVRVLPRTAVFGWYDDMVFGALERVADVGAVPPAGAPAERLWRIAARRALLATGAEERPIAFAGNDRPGVMLAGAAEAYALRFGVAVGRRIAVFANSSAGSRTAESLVSAGAEVVAVLDARADAPSPAAPWRGLADAVVTGTVGGRALRGVTVSAGGRTETIAADALAVSGGWSPRIHLACQRGGRPRWDADLGAFLAPAGRGTLPLAGSAAGAATLAACLAGGAEAAVALLADLGVAARAPVFGAVGGDHDGAPVRPLWRVPGGRGKAFVDFQNDVHVGDLGLAVREGYDHVELAKRYTTTGMATDQGKLGNVIAAGILAEARGVSPAVVGTTTFRPFYTPVSFGALAGPFRGPAFRPVRRTPLHDWAARRGAVFVEAGAWMRASHFPRAGEPSWRETVTREARAVRAAVGIVDMSTLGKVEVIGAEAATLLDRVYCNRIADLPVGRCRYGLMLREDGFVFDDGIVCRLGPEHFVLSAGTAVAAAVLAHLEYCAQVLWPELDAAVVSTAEHWAQVAIAGPRARDVVATLVDADVSADALPYLAAAEVPLLGGAVEGRLFRLSFSGELAFEIAVPAGFAEAFADAAMAAGAAYGITPYGVEAMAVLRVEKGFATHAEINGTVTADDLGHGDLVARDKPDFVGRRMLDREGLRAPGRPQLVGLLPIDPAGVLRAGSHVLRRGDAETLENDQGHVTSATVSSHVGSAVALALVKGGRARLGEEVVVWNGLDGERTAARIVPPVFVDPSFGRIHG